MSIATAEKTTVSDIFNEVDEELRRDRAHELFNRYRPFMVVLTLVIVLGVSGYKSWQWYSARKQARAAEAFNTAAQLLKNGDYEDAQKAFAAFAAKAPKGYKSMAMLEEAAAAARAGHRAQAAKLYTEAAKRLTDPLYKDLATLRSVLVVADDLSLADLDARLSPLTGPGRPFRFTARELLAAKALEEGDAARARQEYSYLSLALDAPTGARNRAGQALAVLGPEPPAAATPKTQSAQSPAKEEKVQ